MDRPGVAAIVGAAQVVQRPDPDRPLTASRGPIELMVTAANDAAADAGAPTLLSRVGLVAVVGGWWRHTNPGALVAGRIGAPGARTALTTISGSAPQELVALAAQRIAAGQLDAALVLGGEARWSAQRLKRAGVTPLWCSEPGDGEPEMVSGLAPEMLDETRRFGSPATAYALFEDRLRVAAGEGVGEHRRRIAELWVRFNAVAVKNELAWDRTPRTVAQIAEPSSDNRMISFPYTKAMVANNTVDMASALLLSSTDAAAAAGVPSDRLVYPHVIASAHETWQVINRHRLDHLPALERAGRVAFDAAGIGPLDVDHVDLYACFPSIVQLSSAALGFSTARPLTMTGGLGFAGAPVANAAGQSLAAMVPAVRRGGWGFVHANGGNATKHSCGIYANHPPDHFVNVECGTTGDWRDAAPDGDGPAVVEAATVAFDRDGPARVVAALLTDDGRRAWASTNDADLIDAAMGDGLAGVHVTSTAAGELRP